MRLLLIVPSLGFTPSGEISPGGLQSFGRCVARVLASNRRITQLSVWTQTDVSQTESLIRRMISVYAYDGLQLDVRAFGGARGKLALYVGFASILKSHDYVMYLLVNQATLSLIPWHPPYAVWEIGAELFQPISSLRQRSLQKAHQLLSISHNTHNVSVQHNPRLPDAHIVHLCVEPPMFEPASDVDSIVEKPYIHSMREPAAFILSRIALNEMYKGHQELIAAWPSVMEKCPDAELWIGGDGDGVSLLVQQVQQLPQDVQQQIHFLGRLSDDEVARRFESCRVFAMPSHGEGFGLVFVEAARYGIPCIGGKHDSAKEVIFHGQTGLLVEQDPVEVAKACQMLLCNSTLAEQLGEAGRRRYREYFQFRHFKSRLNAVLNDGILLAK